MSLSRSPTSLVASLTRLSLLSSNLIRRVLSSPLPSATAGAITLLGHHEHDAPPGSSTFYFKLAFSAFLVLMGGVFSGLTLGLMVLVTSGSEKEQKHAKKVLKLLDRGRHWVLVVLLLSNTIINESLPVFLDSVLGGGVGAVIASTVLIVIFGEIIPQAVCARHGLVIGASCSKFVLALMYLEYPIAYPIARLLDRLLGETHGTVYKRGELRTFVGLHGHIGEEMLNEDEVTIISAVLELSDKPVEAIMTPLEDVYTISGDARLDQARVDEILALGHSRIPIHQPGDKSSFLGMLIVKRLISYDPSQAELVSSFPLNVLPETAPDSTCFDALNYFQQGRSHILLVSKTPGVDGGAIGVVTLEDVIEEMIGEEIIDESDVYVDVHNKIKVVRGPQKPQVAAGKALAPLIQGVIERRRVKRTKTMDYSPMGVHTPPNGEDDQAHPAHPNSTFHTPNDVAIGRAFARMRVRGGALPGKRSDLLQRRGSAGADGRDELGVMEVRPEEVVGHDTAGALNKGEDLSEREGERRPLLEDHRRATGM